MTVETTLLALEAQLAQIESHVDDLRRNWLTLKAGAAESIFSRRLTGVLPAVNARWAPAGQFGINWPPTSPEDDITISGATTWTDAAGYKVMGRLTINSNITLTISRSPFLILCEELVFGNTSSIIDANGPAGAASDPTNWSNYVRGATVTSGSGRSQGGAGGGLLFVVVTGSVSGAAGVIRATGGAGYANTTNAGSNTFRGGEGALAPSILTSDKDVHRWSGIVDETTPGAPAMAAMLLGDGGGGGKLGGQGGGSGGGDSAAADSGGGSGIGGAGGYSDAVATGVAGALPRVSPTPQHLIYLSQLGCRGGGGGAGYVSTTGTNNRGAGGGGGAVVLWVGTEITTATLQANGGAASDAGAAAGAAGVTHRIAL